MQQRTDEWFATRAGKFTGSRFADLMAKTKTGCGASRANLLATLAIERITGKCVETYTNAAMQRGTDLEDEALDAYAFHAGVLVERVGFIEHPTLPFVGISPDGLVGDDGMVEVKCPSAAAKHLNALLHGEHAKEYRWQLQGQLWVSGRKWVDAVSYDPRWPAAMQVAAVRVERDEEAIAELEACCIAAHTEVEEIVAKLLARVSA